MKKLFSLVLIVAAAAKLQAGEAGAGEAGFQIAILPELAIQPADTTIHGLTLNFLCGENPEQGITLGFYNIMTGESAGFTWGAVNCADSYRGVNIGLLNLTQENFSGWQDGLINYTGKQFCGFQSGVINVAGHFRGLQFGVFNYAEKLTGVQIGVLSIAAENRWFNQFPREFAPAIPFVNWSF
jgi:hypothetical protein